MQSVLNKNVGLVPIPRDSDLIGSERGSEIGIFHCLTHSDISGLEATVVIDLDCEP